MFICEIWLFKWFFRSILHILYVEVRLSRNVSEGPFDFEISRVDCSSSANAVMTVYMIQVGVIISCNFALLSLECCYFI